jgi:hypothetical protein
MEANMIVRSKPNTGIIRGRRLTRRARAEHTGASGQGTIDPAGGVAPIPPRSRRQGGQSQDRALYSCSCGFAFDALVSTSVGCPHCGSTQAW